MLNIFIDNIYACHIAFFSSLLKLDYSIITPSVNLTFDFYNTDYFAYYNNMLNILNKETNTYLEVAFFDYYLKNKLNIYTTVQTIGTNIYIPNTPFLFNNIHDLFIKNLPQIEQAEYHFRQLLGLNLQFYAIDRIINQQIISWTIQNMYNRIPSEKEILYHYYHNYNKSGTMSDTDSDDDLPNDIDSIDLFSWLIILYFCPEGRSFNYHIPFFTLIREIRSIFKIPITALLLSGFTDDFMTHYESHKVFIDNPYIDIFIHTWTKMGPRYTYHTESSDISTLTTLYKPVKIQVEELNTYAFSLVGKIEHIFLKECQEHDDATRYINPRLYSLYKSYLLMQSYNQIYQGIIKLNFNLELTTLDYKTICEDYIKQALYVNCHTCKRCTFENLVSHTKQHDIHLNDISMDWFYGNITVAGLACQLYINAFDIYKIYYINNLNLYKLLPYKEYRQFIYILRDTSNYIQYYYEPTLLKHHMQQYWCLIGNGIVGKFNKFQKKLHLI